MVSVRCGWSLDEGWHLWATIQYCADLVLGDGSSAVGLRCVPRNRHELSGRLHDSHVARRRRLVCSQQSDCITSTSSKNNRYDNYGCQASAILHTQNFETKNMSETNDKKCSLQLLTANCPKYCCPRHFYRAMQCTRGTSHGPVSVSQSVSVSVTNPCSTKMAKRRITKITPHDSSGTPVFWGQRSPRNSTVVIPHEGAQCRWGGSKSATFDK